jgi:hypothetical protein
MVEPKRYQKKKRIYTRWDKLTEQVRIISDKKPFPGVVKSFTDGTAGITIEDKDVRAVPAQELVVHHREGEFVLDFLAGSSGGKLRLVTRVIIPAKVAKKLAAIKI